MKNNNNTVLVVIAIVALLAGLLYFGYIMRNTQDTFVPSTQETETMESTPELDSEDDMLLEIENLNNFDVNDTENVLDDDLSDLEQ